MGWLMLSSKRGCDRWENGWELMERLYMVPGPGPTRMILSTLTSGKFIHRGLGWCEWGKRGCDRWENDWEFMERPGLGSTRMILSILMSGRFIHRGCEWGKSLYTEEVGGASGASEAATDGRMAGSQWRGYLWYQAVDIPEWYCQPWCIISLYTECGWCE